MATELARRQQQPATPLAKPEEVKAKVVEALGHYARSLGNLKDARLAYFDYGRALGEAQAMTSRQKGKRRKGEQTFEDYLKAEAINYRHAYRAIEVAKAYDNATPEQQAKALAGESLNQTRKALGVDLEDDGKGKGKGKGGKGTGGKGGKGEGEADDAADDDTPPPIDLGVVLVNMRRLTADLKADRQTFREEATLSLITACNELERAAYDNRQRQEEWEAKNPPGRTIAEVVAAAREAQRPNFPRRRGPEDYDADIKKAVEALRDHFRDHPDSTGLTEPELWARGVNTLDIHRTPNYRRDSPIIMEGRGIAKIYKLAPDAALEQQTANVVETVPGETGTVQINPYTGETSPAKAHEHERVRLVALDPATSGIDNYYEVRVDGKLATHLRVEGGKLSVMPYEEDEAKAKPVVEELVNDHERLARLAKEATESRARFAVACSQMDI